MVVCGEVRVTRLWSSIDNYVTMASQICWGGEGITSCRGWQKSKSLARGGVMTMMLLCFVGSGAPPPPRLSWSMRDGVNDSICFSLTFRN